MPYNIYNGQYQVYTNMAIALSGGKWIAVAIANLYA